MDPVDRLLRSVGLSSTESTVYLAGLTQSAVSVRELLKQTGIKRPTLYHALETLMQKGLAAKQGTAYRMKFSMTSPEHLKHLVDERIRVLAKQKEEVNRLLPLFQQRLPNGTGTQMRIAHYEGIEGIKMVVEEALYCRSRQWEIIAPRKNFFSEFDRAYSKYYLETRRRREIRARSLWEEGTAESDRSLTPSEIRMRDPRYLPTSLHGMFESVILLFDDNVAIISSLSAQSAILMQSVEIHRLFEALFEGLWAIATPYHSHAH